MSNYLTLTFGELIRMKKYQVLPATVFIALLWMGFIYLVDSLYIHQLFSMLIYVDVTTMAILLVGVTMFFEKQEGTFRSFLVSPITKSEYLLAKGTSNCFANFVTLFLLFGFTYWLKDVKLNLLAFILAVAIIGFFHTILGVILSYYAKDFTSLIMRMMVYAFVFVLPVLFEQLGFIKNDFVAKLLYLLPTKSSMTLLNNAAAVPTEAWELYLSISYLIIATIVLFFVALKKFVQFAEKEGGL